MHFPGSAPYTGTWCKYHYYRTMMLHPLGSIGSLLWAAAVLGAILALVLR